MFLACQDTRFILCVFTFLREKPGRGVDVSPLGVGCVQDKFEELGALKMTINNISLGQYLSMSFLLGWISNTRSLSR